MKRHNPLPYIIISSVLVAILIVGCSRTSNPSSQKIKRDPNLLLVFAACSLAPTLETTRDQFVAANTGKFVVIQADKPLALMKRIEQGAVPDILILVGDAEIGMMERAGYLDGGSRTALESLRLSIAVPRGNPDGIARIEDLAAERIRTIAMSTPGLTSLGTKGKRELERAGLWDTIQAKLLLQETADAALIKLAQGEVQAAVIFDPCPRLIAPDNLMETLEIACSLSLTEEAATRIYAVVHKRSPNALLAQRLLRMLSAPPRPENIAIPNEDKAEAEP